MENMDFYIFHFGVKKWTLYLWKKGNDIAHLEKYYKLSQPGIFKNMTPGRKDQNGNYKELWEWRKSTLIELIWTTICTNEKMDFLIMIL